MKKSHSFVVPIVGLMVVLGVAYRLDIWVETLRQDAFQNFTGTLSFLLPANIAQLIIASLILTLLWLIYYKRYNNRIVALIYAVAGLGLLFYSAIAIALANKFPLPVPMELFTLKSFTSAIIAVVGIQQLFTKH